jgi:CubicO group peptidase (beta-lactamase class C family)
MRFRPALSLVLPVLFFAVACGRSAMAIEPVWPERTWATAVPSSVGMDPALLAKARDYALTGGGSGCVIRHGRWVFSWGDSEKRYDLKSSSKSIGMTAVLLAVADGKMQLADKARKYQPALGIPPEENRRTGWLDEITLFHLATQTAGFAKPGGYVEMLYKPGTKWSYSDAGPNWLAECVTLAYRRDLSDLLFERVFTPLGIRPDDLQWRDNAYRPHEIEGIPRREMGSGVHANVDAMARIGLLYLRDGRWKDKQIIPAELVSLVGRTPKAVSGLPVLDNEKYPEASNHYGLLWWNNNDGTLKNVPRDAYWSWGLFDSFIVVIPSLDIVVARAGDSFKGDFAAHYDRLAPFLRPIAESVGHSSTRPAVEKRKPPYPPSPVIRGITWAPKETIRRAGEGSDNWPMTWADDDRQYTAYGDGWGFEPKTKEKLSLGIACVEGGPGDFRGVNIRTKSGEQVGDGASGKKASGMLCVDGVLYMWVRNARNSQLAWSTDHGRTWQWTDWSFATSFGCPTFLNYGKNYAGACDDYVYIYSFDSETAYQPADRMVLARVPKDRIRRQEAYEFYVRLDEKGQPIWSRNIADRGAVFEHPGRCYRSGISYDAGLKRYLWSQIIPGGDTRKQGGFGVYDAPQPWGPWTTVYFTEDWDVGPGESNSFPTRWMSPDGLTVHLVFSGDDHFSVRKATLEVIAPKERPQQPVESVFPGDHWQEKLPAEVGLDPAKLKAFSDFVGGRGCVTRHGYMVYSWGDPTKAGDVASACKAFFSHFLFKAIEDGRVPGLDEKVVKYEPRLGQINEALGFKDRLITWRQLATQTSCYQLTEQPGAAFCYNDYQMALFWDTLFGKVYGASYDTVDEKVFGPLLAGPLGCQDKPTMMAFGPKDRPGRVAISPRDFCRFGLLYLHHGKWRRTLLLDEEHALKAVTSPLPATLPRAKGQAAEVIPGQRTLGSKIIPDNQCPHHASYSFLWWINGVDEQGKRLWPGAPADAFGAFGHGGPRAMVVIPSLDLVLSWNDADIDGWEKVGQAIQLVAAAAADKPPAAPMPANRPRQ